MTFFLRSREATTCLSEEGAVGNGIMKDRWYKCARSNQRRIATDKLNASICKRRSYVIADSSYQSLDACNTDERGTWPADVRETTYSRLI
eukprot:2165746-Pleurochrysis_carterae.AAC.1